MSFLDKVKNMFGIAALFSGGDVDENFWSELEEALIAGDVGLDVSETLVSELRSAAKKNKIKTKLELNAAFVKLLEEKLRAVEGMGQPFDFHSGKLSILLLTGVNGSGKTTSAAKLASQLKAQGKSVIFAAADTFRAAAIEQLKTWGERVGVRVVAQQQGSDPAAVVFDAIQAAKSSGYDILIVDTAGRLHARHNLMEELAKIYRISEREAGKENVQVVLVLDSVMGQNAFVQAESFDKSTPISSIILSKYDNTAKGGIVIAIAEKLRLPVRYIGVGEKIEDLRPFDVSEFIKAIVGVSEND